MGYDAVRKSAVPTQKRRALKCEPDMVQVYSMELTDTCWDHYAKPFTGF
jgi:hypothetical protein